MLVVSHLLRPGVPQLSALLPWLFLEVRLV